MVRPKTIFLDIDGVLLHHYGDQSSQLQMMPLLLPGVIDKLNEWDRKGYNIILVTGRKQSAREVTESQLKSLGIIYDQLIMGIGGGDRIIVNDFKTDSIVPTAGFVCVKRNDGLANVDI